MQTIIKMSIGAVMLFFTVVSVAVAITRRQCLRDPSICPQSCIITLGGCTMCSTTCKQILGKNVFNTPVNGLQGQQSSSGTNAYAGLPLINPNPASSFNGPQNPSGSLQTGFGYNPGNIGPMNPYYNGGSNPGSPNGYSNVGNMGQLAGGSLNPAMPGGNFAGQGVNVNPANLGGNNLAPALQLGGVTQRPKTTTVTVPACPPLYCPSGNIQLQNGCPICIVSTTVKPQTTKQTSVSMTTAVPTPPAVTCTPLRCVAPCDKGITIAPDGCPICLCK